MIEITGKNTEQLINEAGTHRFQRVPPTERKGRVHTSSVTVAITDPTHKKHDPRYTQLQDSDFTICWFSGTGKGGQRRNKVQTCCRITHIPTGITQTVQTRSRISSLSVGMSELHHKLKAEAERDYVEAGLMPNNQIIRTDNFVRHMVIQHNTNKSTTTDLVLRKGRFDLLWA